MTDAPLIPASEPATISYQTTATPLLRRPDIASAGFILFGLSFLEPIGTPLWEFVGHPAFLAVPFSFYIFCESLMIAGTLLVVLAFRRSPLISGRFRSILLAATWAYAAAWAIYMCALIAYGWHFFPRAVDFMRVFVAWFCIFPTMMLAILLLLWLALLRRISFAIDSRPFRVCSTLTLAARAFLVITNLTIPILRFPFRSVFHHQATLVALWDNVDILTIPFMLALSIWCVLLTRPLSKRPAPLPD